MQVIYDSNHGRTKTVTQGFMCEVKHVSEARIWADVVVFICPTYGDEELPHDMEDFLTNIKLENKSYVICETGNYFGYEDFQFGPAKIIEGYLKKLNWKKFYHTFSLDSLPLIDWETFYDWKKGLENELHQANIV